MTVVDSFASESTGASTGAAIEACRWIAVSERLPEDRVDVDVWMEIHASPRSMGWADSFRVPDAHRRGGEWFHRVESGAKKQLHAEYVTHWMPLPPPPARRE